MLFLRVAVKHLQFDIDSFSDTTIIIRVKILHLFAGIPNFNFIIPNSKRIINFVSAHPENKKTLAYAILAFRKRHHVIDLTRHTELVEILVWMIEKKKIIDFKYENVLFAVCDSTTDQRGKK